MDLGGGWYADEELMQYVSALKQAASRVRRRPYESVAEIAFLVDEESILYTHPHATKAGENLLRELQLTGAPVDPLFSFDAVEQDLSRLRLIVIHNGYRLDEQCVSRLKSAAPNAKLLFIGKQKMEIGVEHADAPSARCPEFRVVGGLPLFYDNEGLVTVTVNGDGDFVSGTYNLCASQLRRIAELAGVHCYAPVGCTVYADSRVLSFFPREAVSVELPEGKWRDLLTECAADDKVPLQLPSRGGVAFVKDM